LKHRFPVIVAVAFAALGLFSAHCHASADSLSTVPADNVSGTAAPPAKDGSPEVSSPGAATPGDAAAEAKPDERRLRRKNILLIGGITAVVGTYGAIAWWDTGFSGSFRLGNEQWFGQHTNAGGADKCGHAFSTYLTTRLLTTGFKSYGNPQDRSVLMAAGTAEGILVGVEVMDGLSKKYKFSYEDAVFNTLGVVVGALMEKFPRLDELIDIRWSYWLSEDAKRTGKRDPIGDYSGQTYLLVLKADAIRKVHDVPVLKYLELVAGYGTRGFRTLGNSLDDRTRNVYYGVSLNLSRLLGDTAFRGGLKGGKIQRGTDTVLEYLQIPGTNVLAHHQLAQ
jgi:hypothetical protein